MDSRDNRQHRIRHQQVVPSYSGAVAPIYSGVDTEGFKQKLTIARAIIRKPPLLLLDEPGQMLDEQGDFALIDLIERSRLHSTVIIVTHRPSHIRLADRLVVMNEGNIRYVGSPEDALQKNRKYLN